MTLTDETIALSHGIMILITEIMTLSQKIGLRRLYTLHNANSNSIFKSQSRWESEKLYIFILVMFKVVYVWEIMKYQSIIPINFLF